MQCLLLSYYQYGIIIIINSNIHIISSPRYYSGEKKAPILTIFIGGNHEASNYLQELPYGGWVAPNIYYLGKIYSYYFGLFQSGLEQNCLKSFVILSVLLLVKRMLR